MKIVHGFTVLVGIFLTANIIQPTTADEIFINPEQSDVTDIDDSSLPWIREDLLPIIEEFQNNLFEDLQNSPQVKEIYDRTFDSETVRRVYFKLTNKFLEKYNYPIPAALANVVSKSGSLFDTMTFPIFFEVVANSLAEFLLSKGVEIDRSTSDTYVEILSDELLEVEDPSDAESPAFINAFAGFIQSQGFDLNDENIMSELWLLFASNLIILSQRQ